MKSIALLLLLLLTLPSKATPLPSYCPKPMTIVFYGDWYPYMFYQNEQYKGIDYEFFAAILNKIGCQIVVNRLPEKRAYQGLARGDSLIMSGATITKARQKYAYFSDTYRPETMSIFYLKDEINDDSTVDAIIKQSTMIAINGAAYYGPYIERQRHGNYRQKFQHVPSLNRRVEMLSRSRAQALVEDHIAGCYHLFTHGDGLIDKIKWQQVNQVNVAFMFSKGVVPYEFIEIFNQTMQQLIAQGVYDNLTAKYIPKGC